MEKPVIPHPLLLTDRELIQELRSVALSIESSWYGHDTGRHRFLTNKLEYAMIILGEIGRRLNAGT